MASYRLLSFEKDGATVPGILVDGSVFDLRSEMAVHEADQEAYRSIDELLADWENAQGLLNRISNSPGSRATPLDQAKSQ